jgi:cytochrome c oxidase cbb3-type subunit III
MRFVLIVLAVGLGFAADEADKPVQLPTGPNDLTTGERLFQNNCALCHGTNGGGGRGPLLARSKLNRAPDDAALVKVIELGIEGTEMPGAWQMSEREIRQVAAYVRSLGRIALAPVPGDVDHGSQVYQSNGCAGCHMIKGQGRTIGPELSGIGLRRSAQYLREAVLEPEAALPEDFLQVKIVTSNGQKITGVRLGEDAFTLQVRDYTGRLHSFWKNTLKDIQKERGKSPMPSYKSKLTEAQVTDLVAYLASLREEQ